MNDWPQIDFGHTNAEAALRRGDVYGIAVEPARAKKRPLRLAIAGCGGVMQAKWLPAIRRLQTIGEPLDLVGIADPDAATRAKMGRLAGAPTFADLGSLLAAATPDLVLVLAGDAAHAALGQQAIEAGCACLIEKPLCSTAADAEALVALAAERGTLLAAVANKRFAPPYAMAKALIEQGRLKGAPTVFSAKFTLGYDYVDLLAGGTVHLLDLMGWFMGPVVRLNARGVEDETGRLRSAVISVSFHSGAIGTLLTSAAGLSFKPWERVEIFGDGAFLVVDDQFETTLYDDETGPAKSWRPAIPNTLLFDESFGGYAGLLENVLDAIRGLAPLSASGADGAAAVGLIEAIRHSLRSGAEIDLTKAGFLP